ncbi:MAG: hypothetical protein EAX96_02230 [Candidatus Lokiarchaeota archaeon]|nr:hypothetical protein [Candidatus Lokiarchaeota archaeon]
MIKKITQIILQTSATTPETIRLNESAFGSTVVSINFKKSDTGVDYISIQLEDGRYKNFLLNKLYSWTSVDE